jgi:hypothetical protein
MREMEDSDTYTCGEQSDRDLRKQRDRHYSSTL